MSSTNRGSRRELDDHYATPYGTAKLICESVRDRIFDGEPQTPLTILEPGCGEGLFLDAIAETFHPESEVHGVELNPNLAYICREKGHKEVTNMDYFDFLGPSYDLILGNPPFKYAERFIQTSRNRLDERGTLAFILRMNFAGSQKRYRTLFSKYKPYHIFQLVARPHFQYNSKSGDSVEYAVFLWGKGSATETGFSWIDNRNVNNRHTSDPFQRETWIQ